jgi:23S rRNA pseudouridine2604 synthase
MHEPPEPVRLSKLMASRGLCSRREADEFIARGWVLVDGVVTNVLGVRVPETARIELLPAARREQSKLATFLLNKPVGFVSGQPEKGYEPAVKLLTPENRWEECRVGEFEPSQLRGLAPAGRLDIDSKGLIVFTQDGRIAKQLTGENSEIEKEYLVRVRGAMDDNALTRLRHGLELDGEPLRPAVVEAINDDQLRMLLVEGKKRQIRRMCELVGLRVTGLKRVRIGGVRLGKLPEGRWRYLGPTETFEAQPAPPRGG